MKFDKKQIKIKFSDCDIISTADLYRFYQSEDPEIKETTINWRIYELVRQGILYRIGRGKFTLGKSVQYLPVISNDEIKINNIIKKEFPFIKYCIWSTLKISEFLQHQSSFRFLIVEVEKEAVDSVYYTIKDKFDSTFKKPSKEIIEEYISTQKNSIILKAIVSEAPVQTTKDIPTSSLEKLLVDLYCDKKLFYFLQGNELVHIYRNAFNKYTVNESKLLRYADRRFKKMQLDEFVKSIFRQ